MKWIFWGRKLCTCARQHKAYGCTKQWPIFLKEMSICSPLPTCMNKLTIFLISSAWTKLIMDNYVNTNGDRLTTGPTDGSTIIWTIIVHHMAWVTRAFAQNTIIIDWFYILQDGSNIYTESLQSLNWKVHASLSASRLKCKSWECSQLPDMTRQLWFNHIPIYTYS